MTKNKTKKTKKEFLIKGLQLAGFRSVREFARHIGRSETTVWRILNGVARSRYVEEAIALTIGCSVDTLWTYEYTPKSHYSIENKEKKI